MSYEELLAKIEELGVHELLGPTGRGVGIEHNPHELATFVAAITKREVQLAPGMVGDKIVEVSLVPAPPMIQTVLEIGTGYKSGLSRFMSDYLRWQVTTIDAKDYQHTWPGITYLVSPTRVEFDHQFDLVIIDADHHYESVEADYIHYGPRADKVVAFHDICGLRDCEGAARFWHELAYTKKGALKKGFYEAIADDERRSGIGWLVK